jgi:hypothetical protein
MLRRVVVGLRIRSQSIRNNTLDMRAVFMDVTYRILVWGIMVFVICWTQKEHHVISGYVFLHDLWHRNA